MAKISRLAMLLSEATTRLNRNVAAESKVPPRRMGSAALRFHPRPPLTHLGWFAAINGRPGTAGREKASRGGQEPVIVAIGASAGGIPALQATFSALPDKTGAAFIIIVHLDPERRSELPAILATRTRMPVVEIENASSSFLTMSM
jgi:chemotaxis response regulator CheB